MGIWYKIANSINICYNKNMDEIKILEKSGILLWSEDNINNVKNSNGFYVLRSSPVNGDIVSIDSSEDIKNDILKKYKDFNLDEVKFFEWYRTASKLDAEILIKQYKQDHHLF